MWRSDWQGRIGSVWYYTDEENHRVIVEWYDVPNYFGSVNVTFQAILYDPDFYPTPTGDSPIKYQYLTATRPFEATIGIEDATGANGVQYAYQLQLDEYAAPIASGRALLITTDSPWVWAWWNPSCVPRCRLLHPRAELPQSLQPQHDLRLDRAAGRRGARGALRPARARGSDDLRGRQAPANTARTSAACALPPASISRASKPTARRWPSAR